MSSRLPNRIRDVCIDLENALSDFQSNAREANDNGNKTRPVTTDEDRIRELRQTLLRIKKQLGSLSV